MEAYVLKYKVRRFVARLWYWTRQILLVGLLLALLLLVWRWQDRTAEHIRSRQGDSITVVDGDSIVLRQGSVRQTIRISGIDAQNIANPAPMKKAQHGRAARKRARRWRQSSPIMLCNVWSPRAMPISARLHPVRSRGLPT
ncbi:hypothetical protein [Pseudonocardia sp. TMWB2A]|uniref:hypothetical protein n=1 Tax=Pseudonocardia sp. TMWB2A TaxID=687430 RepID=UPI00307D2C7C